MTARELILKDSNDSSLTYLTTKYLCIAFSIFDPLKAVESIKCYDCMGSRGGCKTFHSIVNMDHLRCEDPSCTFWMNTTEWNPSLLGLGLPLDILLPKNLKIIHWKAQIQGYFKKSFWSKIKEEGYELRLTSIIQKIFCVNLRYGKQLNSVIEKLVMALWLPQEWVKEFQTQRPWNTGQRPWN